MYVPAILSEPNWMHIYITKFSYSRCSARERLRNHSHATSKYSCLGENMFDNSRISISKIQLNIISIVRPLRLELFDEVK